MVVTLPLEAMPTPTPASSGPSTELVSGFTPTQVNALRAPLDRANVQVRSQSGRQLSYIEGWHAIAEANRIFGFDRWQRETVDIKCVSERERKIGRDQKPGWGVTYTARVRVTVYAGGMPPLIREGCGAGHGIDVDPGQAHESALKEAETDAMKRALMTFGNPFGLALYDKSQSSVADAPGPAGCEPDAALIALATLARAVCDQAGLTDAGLRAFLHPCADLTELPPHKLHRLAKAGLSPQTVERCNAAGEHGDELPATYEIQPQPQPAKTATS